MHLWTRVAGVSEYSLRFPSALLGAGSVGLVAFVGRRLIGETGGLLAALLLVVSPLHVHYSQEARPYSAAVFLTLLSIVLLLRLSDEAPAGRWIAYGAVVALVPLVHLLAGLALLPHGAVLWPLRHRRRQLGLAVVAALVVLGMLLPLGWAQAVRTAHDQSGIAFASPAEPLQGWARPVSLATVLAGVGSSTTRLLGLEYAPFGWRARQLLPLSVPLLCLGLTAGWSRPHPQRTLLLGGAFLPVLATAALSVWYGHVVPLQDRYSSWTIPFWALLLVHGAMRFRARSATCLVISMLVMMSAGLVVGRRAVGWPRECVRASEVRSFLACAPITQVLHVADAWQAAVVTALASREVTLLLGTELGPESGAPAFYASDSGLCRRPRPGPCQSAIPVCAERPRVP
jgi:uncharacterized membrane protein